MEIKVGRKYIDEEFILKVSYIERGYAYYDAFNTRTNVDCGQCRCRISEFMTFKPLHLKVKATRLARKLYPNAEEENGMLILEEEC